MIGQAPAGQEGMRGPWPDEPVCVRTPSQCSPKAAREEVALIASNTTLDAGGAAGYTCG